MDPALACAAINITITHPTRLIAPQLSHCLLTVIGKYELLQPYADRVVVCNVRGRSETTKKSDRIDADWLSEQLRLGALRSVYHGEDSTRVMLRVKGSIAAAACNCSRGERFVAQAACRYAGRSPSRLKGNTLRGMTGVLASAPRVTMKDQRHLFCLALFALNLLGCDRPGASAVPLTSGRVPPILLCNGTGTSPNDVAAIETLLEQSRISYSTASSAQLDEMSAARLRSYHLIIVPGGDFTRIGLGLRKDTAAKLRDAVQSGVSYLGICAGAFFAGHTPDNGLNLTSGVQFGFYSAEARGIRKAAVPISGAGTPTLDQYWEDGPQLTGWGAVVGKYPAPASVDHAYAMTLTRSALDRRPLPHF